MRRSLACSLAAVLVGVVAAVAPLPARGDDITIVPVRQIGGTGHAELYAWGMATALDGTILVGDYWNFRIARYATDGTYLGTVVSNHGEGQTQHQTPYGIATDPVNGDIYFGDVDGGTLPNSPNPFGNMIDKYSASGQYLTSWGTKGTSGIGKYQYPSYPAVHPNRNVYFVDQWAHRIIAHTPTGTELFRFGTMGTGNGQFRQPRGLAFDAQNRLFVADSFNQRIQVFDQNGTYLFKFSGPGTTPGLLGNDLRGLAIDKANGWVYVADTSSGMVNKFDTNGTFLTRFGGYGNTLGKFVHGGRGITIDADSNVWVGDMGGFRAQKFDPNGNALLQVPAAPSSPPTGGFNQPRGIAVDTLGNTFVTDTHNWRIQKFDPNGNFVTAWGTRGGDLYKYNYQRGIAVDPRNNDVVVADTDNHKIKKYNNDGVFVLQFGGFGPAAGQFKFPHGVDVGADGKIYVSDTQNRRVQVFDPNGTPLLQFGSLGNGNGQFQFNRNIGVDPVDASMWVSDSVRGVVQHFSPTGQYLGRFGTPGQNDDQLFRPDDLEADTGHVYVADADADKIKVWHKDGTFEGAYGGPGVQLGKFQRPHGLDLRNGLLYVAEQTGERGQVLQVGTGGPPDTTNPDTVLSVPTANQSFLQGPIAMSGSATDNVGVAGVNVSIKDTATGLWWTGSQWGSFTPLSATLATPGATSTGWTFTWNAPAAGSYSVQAEARDSAGNIDQTKPLANFTVTAAPTDTTAPNGTVTFPTNNATVPSAGLAATGNATDNVGVVAVDVMIKNRANNQYWNGVAWVSTFTWISNGAVLAAPGATATPWTFDWTPPGAGIFAISVRARDATGNIDTTRPWINFTVT